jgi:hypothetical protein
MRMNKLLLVLRPFSKDLKSYLPSNMIPVYPFYTTVSRLNYKPDAFDFKLVTDYVPLLSATPNHNLSFSDICDKKAIELLNLNEKIFVMWSGGIDSTTVLVSILKNWPASEFFRITVLCNIDSIKENKSFFHTIVKYFKTEISSSNIESFLKRGIVVTGEFGDQLFGADGVGKCIKVWGNDVIYRSWKDILPVQFKKHCPITGLAAFENYLPIINESPFEIETVQDFYWWWNFTQNWQHIKLRTLMSTTWTDPKLYFPKLIHFFESTDFQIWSLHNHDKKIKDTWDSYKFTAKDYILSYTGDVEYNAKLKVPSLQRLYYDTEIHWGIDEDWNFLDKEETLKRIKHD